MRTLGTKHQKTNGWLLFDERPFRCPTSAEASLTPFLPPSKQKTVYKLSARLVLALSMVSWSWFILSIKAMEAYFNSLTQKLRGFARYQGFEPERYTFLFDYDPGDWLISTDDGVAITLNTEILDRCTEGYYDTVAVHELHHVLRGGIPKKSDAKAARAFFGDFGLRIIDVEADLETFVYLHDRYAVGYPQWLMRLHEGQMVFHDPKIIIGKFERWMATVASTRYYALYKKKRIMVPNVASLGVDGTIAILLIDSIHHFAHVPFPHASCVEATFLYQEGYTISPESFADRCQAFADTFLEVVGF